MQVIDAVYEKPRITVMDEDEVLAAFQMTAAEISAAGCWWNAGQMCAPGMTRCVNYGTYPPPLGTTSYRGSGDEDEPGTTTPDVMA